MRIVCILIIIWLIGCCSGYAQSNKLDSKDATDALNAASKGKSRKPKKSYKSNKYHSSFKQHDKVSDVVLDQSLKNASEIKKANTASSKKFKKSQSDYLNYLNSNTRNKSKHA